VTRAKQWLWVGAITALLLLSALLGIARLLEERAEDVAAAAARRHPGSSLEALVAQMEDGDLPWRERNRAVWALGQLGDSRALAPLRSHITGRPCEHEKHLCEDQLRMAVRKLEGDWLVNPPWRWRRASME
jgi:HEAT repeat protein